MPLRRFAVLTAFIAGAGTLVSAQTPIWTPVLEYRVVAASPNGDRTTTSGSSALPLGGQPATFVTRSSADLCTTGGGGGVGAAQAPATDNVLNITAAFLASDSNGVRVKVTSQFERTAGTLPAPWSQTITFKEGEEVTLETMRASIDGPCHVRNLTIRAKVVLRASDPAAQAARYVADVWLVHDTGVGDNGTGSRRTQSVAVSLSGNGPTPFAFAPLAFALPVLSPNQGDLQLYVDLSGSLRPRVRADGQIDIDVATTRSFALRHPSDEPGLARGAGGMKTLTVKEDETVAIDLPAGTGMMMHALTPDSKFNVGAGVRAGAAGATPPVNAAVSVKNDRMTVVFEEFFKGHKTQILIRLRKVRE